MQLPKEYLARIRFGLTTTTDDFEGDVIATRDVNDWSPEVIADALNSFLGDTAQVPPAVSAVKIGGRPSYRIARTGKVAPLAPRIIRVHELQLLAESKPEITLRVRCSRGTYVRALARDLGGKLGWGGTLAELTRTAVGPYRRGQALALRDIYLRRCEFSSK